MAAIAAMLIDPRDAVMTTAAHSRAVCDRARDYLTMNTRMPSSLPASRSSTWIVV